MGKKKVISLLGALSEAELRQFQRWVKQAHRQGHPMVRLLHYLSKQHPDFENARLDNDLIRGKVFRQEEKSGGKDVSNLFSALYKELKTFLIQEEWNLQTEQQERLFLDVLLRKGLMQQYAEEIDAGLAARRHQAQSWWHAFHNLELHYLQYFAPQLNVRPNTHLLGAVAELETFYRIGMLKMACELINRKNVLNQAPPSSLLNQVEKWIQELDQPKEILFQTYGELFLLLRDRKPEQFGSFFTQFWERLPHFAPEEQQAILRYLVNVSSHLSREGDLRYLPAALQLLSFGFRSGLLLIMGYVSGNVFLNTLELALALGERAWARQLLSEYLEKIKPLERELTSALARAYLAYQQRDFRHAHEILATLHPADSFFKLRIRVLLIQLYWDQREMVALSTALESFERFLFKEKKINPEIALSYRNFVRGLRYLDSNENILRKQKEIDLLRPIIYKKWLLDRLESK